MGDYLRARPTRNAPTPSAAAVAHVELPLLWPLVGVLVIGRIQTTLSTITCP